MNDEDKLFQQNPLLAIWLKLKENNELLKEALEPLDAEDTKDDEDDSYG